jgi:hypothetical protein
VVHHQRLMTLFSTPPLVADGQPEPARHDSYHHGMTSSSSGKK